MVEVSWAVHCSPNLMHTSLEAHRYTTHQRGLQVLQLLTQALKNQIACYNQLEIIHRATWKLHVPDTEQLPRSDLQCFFEAASLGMFGFTTAKSSNVIVTGASHLTQMMLVISRASATSPSRSAKLKPAEEVPVTEHEEVQGQNRGESC